MAEELTKEQKEKVWEIWVRNEINGLLDMYLSKSKDANVNIKYDYLIKEQYEDGTVLADKCKATGVKVFMQFDFDGVIDLTKPAE